MILKDGVAHDGTADNVVDKLLLKVLNDERFSTELKNSKQTFLEDKKIK